MTSSSSLHAKAPQSEWRYERKYLIHNLHVAEVQEILFRNPLVLHEIYEQRVINNVYYDTADYSFFRDSVHGHQKRIKVRLRWYGTPEKILHAPVLEFKIKNGQSGRKILIDFPEMSKDEVLSANSLDYLLAKKSVPENLQVILSGLKPVLFNRYVRTYHLSSLFPLRVTIDSQLEASSLLKPLAMKKKTDTVVVEAKYAPTIEAEALHFLSLLPFRLSRVSKYVTGLRSIL